MRHPHADVIQRWLEDTGLPIQSRKDESEPWRIVRDPSWYPTNQYRVAEPNTVRYGGVFLYKGGQIDIDDFCGDRNAVADGINNSRRVKIIRIEIDPNTLELVSATLEGP